MKKIINLIIMLIVFVSSAGCTAMKNMKGTYVSLTPLVELYFDSDHYDIIGFAYTPESDDGKLFKKELEAVFIEEQFKVVSGTDESDAVLKTGLKFDKEVTLSDAQKLGKLMKAKAVIIVKKAEFPGGGKAGYISLEIADSYGGILVRATYKGGDNPDDIDRAARSIVYGIQSENIKIETRREDNKD